MNSDRTFLITRFEWGLTDELKPEHLSSLGWIVIKKGDNYLCTIPPSWTMAPNKHFACNRATIAITVSDPTGKPSFVIRGSIKWYDHDLLITTIPKDKEGKLLV